MLAAGSPAAQTFNAAMGKMLGGATGLKTALMITGGRMGEFQVRHGPNRGGRARTSGKTVEDWDKIQTTFNQKLDRLKYSAQAAGITIGTVLLPAATALVDGISATLGPIAGFITKHQQIVGLVLSVAAGAAAAAVAIKAVALAERAWAVAQGLVNTVMAIFDAELAVTGIPELIIAIAALVAGLIYAWNHFSTFREVVIGALKAVEEAGLAVWHGLVMAWHAIVTAAVATWHALETAWNAVAGAAVALWRAVTGVWDTIRDATTTVWNAISGFFQKWWPLLLVIFLPFIALLLATWNHFHEQITGTAKAAWGAVKAALSATWAAIEAVARTVWAGIRLAIVDPVVATWHTLQSIWNAIRPWLSGVWGGIKGAASTAWAGIKNAIISPLASAWHTVTSTVGHIKSAVTSGLNAAWNAVKGIGGRFVSIGADIVRGIAQGISDSAGVIADRLKGAASSALSDAKSFLGIGSPSRLFANEVGKWIPHGIAQGVAENAGVAGSAIRAMAAGLPGTLVGPRIAGGGYTAGGLAGAGAGGSTVVFDLRGSQVMSDRDMDTLVGRIGRQLATRGLPQGGVRIRM